MSSKTSEEHELAALIIEALNLEDVDAQALDPETPLFKLEDGGLGLDSIDALELVVSLEKKFGVSVPNSETARQALATVNALHDYVVANRKA